SDLLEKFGGHKYAAGLTLDASNLEAFQKRFEEVVSATITADMMTPVIEIDYCIPLDAVNAKFLNVLKQMCPFGPENPRPVFEANNLYVFNSLSSFKDRHIKFLVGHECGNRMFQAVCFDMTDYYERNFRSNSFRMAFTVEENVYNGMTSIPLRIKDIKF